MILHKLNTAIYRICSTLFQICSETLFTSNNGLINIGICVLCFKQVLTHFYCNGNQIWIFKIKTDALTGIKLITTKKCSGDQIMISLMWKIIIITQICMETIIKNNVRLDITLFLLFKRIYLSLSTQICLQAMF